MAKVIPEEPRYNCGGDIDGRKVYNYFNPPEAQILQGKQKIKDGIKKIAIGVGIAVLGIGFKIASKEIPWGLMFVLLLVGAVVILIGVLGKMKGDEIVANGESKRVSDAEYDRMEAVMFNGIVKKGMEYLNLDEDEVAESEPLVLHRYLPSGIRKTGADGKTRCTENVATVFFFSADTLYTYEHKFSMMNTVTSDSTMTLFYTDIVSVQVNAVDVNDAEEGSIAGIKNLTIGTVGGQQFQYSFVSTEQTNRSINAMQSLFRIKKKGIQ